MRWLAILLIVALPLVDLGWNLTHLNIGLVDFYGVTLPALGLVQNHAWPATPYFPAGYPLLLIPFGILGSTLVGGYVLSALGALLALAGVRRLALELGAAEEWTLAAIALAWAEPAFRVTAGSPTPDMLFTGLGVWFLWSAVAIWRGFGEGGGRRRGFAVGALAVSAFALPLLRYHGYILVVPIVAALLASGKLGNLFATKKRPFDAPPDRYAQLVVMAIVLSAAVNFLPYYPLNGPLPPSAAGLQVRVGLEADKPTYYKSTDALFADYGTFAVMARKRSVIGDYGVAEVARHALLQWSRFLRRPPIAIALVLFAIALLRRRLEPGVAPLALWILLYSLALGVAYYTPRAALLEVLAGVGLVFALLPKLCSRSADLALAAASVAMLLLYWPAGRFARADLAQRSHYAKLSRQVAEGLIKSKTAPADNITGDMRIIWLPSQSNPWQKPYPNLDQTWLNDPAMINRQLPGYRDDSL